jgi:hypothetical protein
VLRASAVGLVVACAFVGAPVALGQQGTTSYPQELWKAYPLEQQPATQAPPPSEQRPVVASTDGDSSGSPLWWIVAAAAGVSLVLLLAVASRRRRRAEPSLVVPASWPPPAPPKPTATRSSRPAGPTCQVRWSPRSDCFVAIATDQDGSERRIARSPRVDAGQPEPPEQEPEFEAALKVLSKQLRDLGWRPLRARGMDFDERRWYARRFRWPTEAEQQAGAKAPPSEHVGMQAKRGDA